MTQATTIDQTALRLALIKRAAAYAEANKSSLSKISEEAVRDSKFLARVRDGKNFTIANYQRVVAWLDERERAA